MSIRHARPEDAEDINTLLLKAGQTGRGDFSDSAWEHFIELSEPQKIRERLANDSYLTLCCCLDGRLVGIIAVKNLQKIDQLFVLQENRRSGIATRLWNSAKEICLREGSDGHFSVKSSTQAVPVYEKFGFVTSGSKTSQNGVQYTPMELTP